MRRFAVRALLVDHHDRLLLLRGEEPESGAGFWFPPGGGVQADEDLIDALRREVSEEVGFSDLRLGPEVWRRRHRYAWRGTSYDQRERWFLCRVPHFAPDGAGRTATETVDLTRCRWWTVAELARATERLVPGDLADRLRRLLADGPPAKPETIGR
ncbi:MAG: NUDIX domain-containing protein [Actinomycetia bacterium]|nr:NUDIX domain-containing protein [Actinomycetes bacterium]